MVTSTSLGRRDENGVGILAKRLELYRWLSKEVTNQNVRP